MMKWNYVEQRELDFFCDDNRPFGPTKEGSTWGYFVSISYRYERGVYNFNSFQVFKVLLR